MKEQIAKPWIPLKMHSGHREGMILPGDYPDGYNGFAVDHWL